MSLYNLSENAKDLADSNGGWWASHPEFPLEDWKYHVANDEVRDSYWEWVAMKVEHSES